MSVYCITYDLNSHEEEYRFLLNDIQSISKSSLHLLNSVWLVESDLNVIDINSKLSKNLDSNDALFIVEVKNNYGGWLPFEYDAAERWMASHIKDGQGQ